MKDAFHRYVIDKELDAIDPKQRGTKVCAHYVLTLKPNESFRIKVKLDNRDCCCDVISEDPFATENFDDVMQLRREETDEFYSKVLSGRDFLKSSFEII